MNMHETVFSYDILNMILMQCIPLSSNLCVATVTTPPMIVPSYSALISFAGISLLFVRTSIGDACMPQHV